MIKCVYVLLWSLLLIVPGIIKAFAYSQTYFIAVEHPDWGANQCITESRRLMDSNKWRLFCLGFSFIGWYLLIGLTAFVNLNAIAQFFLAPYTTLAFVAFYNEIKAEKGQPVCAQIAASN